MILIVVTMHSVASRGLEIPEAFEPLADRLDPRRLFALSAVVAAGANLAILLFEPSSPMVILCRFITGMCMAGIYPVGMKLATTWAQGGFERD